MWVTTILEPKPVRRRKSSPMEPVRYFDEGGKGAFRMGLVTNLANDQSKIGGVGHRATLIMNTVIA